jgi:hypothetical protein
MSENGAESSEMVEWTSMLLMMIAPVGPVHPRAGVNAAQVKELILKKTSELQSDIYPLQQHLGRRRFRSNTEVEMAVGEWL